MSTAVYHEDIIDSSHPGFHEPWGEIRGFYGPKDGPGPATIFNVTLMIVQVIGWGVDDNHMVIIF
ncbi:MAG: hypothetical protein Kow0021_02740 [Methanothermobacter thermautotrophicus]